MLALVQLFGCDLQGAQILSNDVLAVPEEVLHVDVHRLQQGVHFRLLLHLNLVAL